MKKYSHLYIYDTTYYTTLILKVRYKNSQFSKFFTMTKIKN